MPRCKLCQPKRRGLQTNGDKIREPTRREDTRREGKRRYDKGEENQAELRRDEGTKKRREETSEIT